MLYKIFQPITVRCKDTQGVSNRTDISMIVTSPNGSDLSAITMNGIGGGHYQASFNPNLCGRWIVRIVCNSNPKNNAFAKEYLIAQEIVNNLQGEQFTYVGKTIGSIDGANKIHCNLWNNSSSIIKIQKIISQVKFDAAGTGKTVSYEGIKTSSQGTGIFVNIIGLDSQAPTLSGISFITSFSASPSIVSNGELFSYNLHNEESNPGLGNSEVFKSGFGVSPIIIRPNEGLCIKQSGLSGAGKVNIFYYFTID